MSASPQANQGLDDGPALDPALVPAHTGDDGEPDQPIAHARLSDLAGTADENNVKDEEGEPSDDQPEDAGRDPDNDDGDGDDDNNSDSKDVHGEAEDDDEDDDDVRTRARSA